MQHVSGFLPWMLFGQPSLLAQYVDLDVHLYYAAIQNLVCGSGNESSDTPAIHCAQYVQQSVDMSIHVPAGLQCDSVQIAEVIQQNYVLVVVE